MSDEDFLQRLEEESRERQERLRTELMVRGRFDVLDGYDAAMRDLDLGITGARGCWHALSKAQRKALREAAEHGMLWSEINATRYVATNKQGFVFKVANKPTIRNLIARELLACDGGIVDPECVVRITERGLFILKHGPVGARLSDAHDEQEG